MCFSHMIWYVTQWSATMWWPHTSSPRKIAFRLFLFRIVRGEAARQRVAKRREKNEVSRALSNREHGFSFNNMTSWVFEERTSGARVLDMGKRSRTGAYKATTPLYLKVFNHWKKVVYCLLRHTLNSLMTRKPKV